MRQKIRLDSTKRIFSALFVFLLSFFVLFNSLSSQQTAGELFQEALYMEEAEGDLEKAIEIYKKILKQYPDIRKVAAKAQLHIGLCYEKLGLKEAKDAYEKVIAEYPDQAEETKLAREKLNRLLRAKMVLEKGDKELRMHKVFTGQPRDFVGAPSPDGRYFSTTDWDTGNLVIKEIPSGQMHQLTHKAGWEESVAYALYSVWSPDGKRLAYSWYNEEGFFELRTIGLDGSEPRTLYKKRKNNFVQPFDWSPDGKHILAGLEDKKGIIQIATVSILDGSVKILKEGLIHSCFYSPDGNFIVYDFMPEAQKESRGRDIMLLPVQGGAEVPLVNHPAHDVSLCWDPQGKRLLFMSDRTGNMDVWSQEVNNGKLQGEPYLIKKNMGKILPLGLTKDGALFYKIETSMDDVYTATLDFEKYSLLAPPKKAEKLFIGANHSPDYSPDGRYLAYISRRTYAPGRFEPLAICMLSLETGKKSEFFPDLKHIRFIRWSADGKNFFSYGFGQNGFKGIYSISARTGEADLILKCTTDEFIPELDVFIDGKRIVYKMLIEKKAGEGNVMSIRIRDLQSGKEAEIYHKENCWETHHVALSSDGEWIAFDDRVPQHGLKVIPVTGGEPKELCRMKDGEAITSFHWVPDSQDIFFTKGIAKKTGQLWRISLREEKQHQIELSMRRLMGLCFHPDGKRIAFSAGYIEAELWVMENLLRLEKVEKVFK